MHMGGRHTSKHRMSSGAVGGNREQSEAMGINQKQPGALRSNQIQSAAIRSNRKQSKHTAAHAQAIDDLAEQVGGRHVGEATHRLLMAVLDLCMKRGRCE